MTATQGKKSQGYGRYSRTYTLPDGSVYDSVTSILGVLAKPALISWAANVERAACLEASADLYEDFPAGAEKMSRAAYIETLERRLSKEKAHQKALTKAGNIGSEAHALIEWNIRKGLGQLPGKQPEVSPPAAKAFAAYQAWRDEADLFPLKIEEIVYSRKREYAGTLDLFARIHHAPSGGAVHAVLDWKTGKAIYNEALLQNAAYIHAFREMGHILGECWGCIVRLPKVETDPDFEVRWISPDEQAAHFEGFMAAKRLWDWQSAQNAQASQGDAGRRGNDS